MNILSYESYGPIPIFKCSQCGQCIGIETENSFGANRGCCFYFPKYTLIDIRNIAENHVEFLETVYQNPNTAIHEFDMVVTGHYDRTAHEAFMKQLAESDSDTQKDHFADFDPSLQFRRCLFNSDTGCTIDFNRRPHPCNLYLCRSVIDQCGEKYRNYSRERKAYFAYCHFMNEMLAEVLKDHDLTLVTDFQKSIAVLRDTPIDDFSFDELEPLCYE